LAVCLPVHGSPSLELPMDAATTTPPVRRLQLSVYCMLAARRHADHTLLRSKEGIMARRPPEDRDVTVVR